MDNWFLTFLPYSAPGNIRKLYKKMVKRLKRGQFAKTFAANRFGFLFKEALQIAGFFSLERFGYFINLRKNCPKKRI